jgi:nitrogen regulatory protein PII
MAVAKQLQGREVAMKENVAVTRKIFVSTIDDAIRIRTCEKGNAAI